MKGRPGVKGQGRRLLAGLALAWAAAVHGAIEPREFATPEQDALYRELIEELRCLVCQNQNLAESNAPLAKDLRDEVAKMVAAGKGREEVVGFLVARYGDFVLYRPPLRRDTWLLWAGPFLLLAAGLGGLAAVLRRRARAASAPPDPEALRQARLLLEREGEGPSGGRGGAR